MVEKTFYGQRNHPTKSEILAMPTKTVRFHDHPLYWQVTKADCLMCDPWDIEDNVFFYCVECEFSAHRKCIESFFIDEYGCGHFLEIPVSSASVVENGSDRCHCCRGKLSSAIASCTVCNISMHLKCLHMFDSPPPSTMLEPKLHEHTLTLLSRQVTFTCNACGQEGNNNPYVCLECNLTLHQKCIDFLPRVININRHDHRISHTFQLRQGDWECGVCRKTIDWVYGAFTCSVCPSYAVHSRCATRKEVWDGIELEDMPEEEEEIEDPFKRINETDIIHFSHDHEEHILRLDENCDTDNDDMRCGGCVLPINEGPCYKCVECDFSLHKVCASLPRKIRHLLHNRKNILEVECTQMFDCKACGNTSDGFRYEPINRHYLYHDEVYDVRCSSLSEPVHHDLHRHPLYFTLERSKICHACGKGISNDPLNCLVCEGYALCIRCATLPRKVKHRCDDHFLSLCQGAGNASGDLWCDICETKTDPSVCYYTCVECGLSLHIDCVLGDLYYVKVGTSTDNGLQIQLLPNNGLTRPRCGICENRCVSPFLMKMSRGDVTIYICSMHCCKVLYAKFYSDAHIR